MEMVIKKGFFRKFFGLFGWIFSPSFWIKFIVIMCIVSIVWVVIKDKDNVPVMTAKITFGDGEKEQSPIKFTDTEIDEMVTFAEKIEAIIQSKLENFESSVNDAVDREYDSVRPDANKYGFVVVKGSNGCYTYRDGDGWVADACGKTYADGKSSMDKMIVYRLEQEALKTVTWQDAKGE